ADEQRVLVRRLGVAGMRMSRRDLLRCSGMGLGALAMTDLLKCAGFAQDDAAKSPLAPRVPHFAPKARRVLHLFANGGPSQMDTFDPKPALEKYAGKPLPADQPRA